jgi:benzoate-CoA ligase family protein
MPEATVVEVPDTFNVCSFFVDRHAQSENATRPALITPDRSVSYAELGELTNRTGHVLRDVGVRRGDRVLLAVSDGAAFVATWYAVLKIGGITAEAYTFLPDKDLAYLVDYTGAAALVADRLTLEVARRALARTQHRPVLLVTGVADQELRSDEVALDSRLEAAPSSLAAVETHRDDIAIWKFTTGSTGPPKAAVHTHAHPLISFQLYARQTLGLAPDDVVLPVPKLFFGYARDMTALFPFGVGAAGIVFPNRTTADVIFEQIAMHLPSVLVNVPTMMRQMIDHPRAASQDLSCLRLCTSAGEALPPELHRQWRQRFGVEVIDGLGSSEAYHIYMSNRPGDVRDGSVGRPVPGYGARLLDADQHEVPTGESGELWLTGPTVANSYWGRVDKSRATFAGNEYRTGDVLRRDEDGYFWFEGRVDDLLKVGGVWVAPAEVEACLMRHPAVADCAVVGYENDGLVLPRAWVVARPHTGGGADLARTLQNHVREQISPHKYPRQVCFVDHLPRTPSGKLDRRELAKAR